MERSKHRPSVSIDHPAAAYRAGLNHYLESVGFATVTTLSEATDATDNSGPMIRVVYVDDASSWHRLSVDSKIPSVFVIALFPTLEPDVFLQGLRAGAHGVVHVDAEPQTIARVIEAALDGETVLPTQLAHAVAAAAPANVQLEQPLDPMEQSILQRLSDGESFVSIANSHFVSERTLRRQLDNIFLKLGVTNRQSALKKATHLNIVR